MLNLTERWLIERKGTFGWEPVAYPRKGDMGAAVATLDWVAAQEAGKKYRKPLRLVIIKTEVVAERDIK